MKIALCTPAYDGRVHDGHMVSVSRTMHTAANRGIEMVHIIGRGSPILPDVRNWCVAQALLEGCDKVWFVDSDISWQTCINETINMLLAPVDMVCGVHQKRNTTWNDPAELVVRWKTIPPTPDEETGLWEVSDVATAFLCIDKRVFKMIDDAGLARQYLPHSSIRDGKYCKFNRNYFWYNFVPARQTDEEAESIIANGYDGPMEILQGEDFYFCEIAKKAGARIFVDPRIELVHFDGCVQHNVSVKNTEFMKADALPDIESHQSRAA